MERWSTVRKRWTVCFLSALVLATVLPWLPVRLAFALLAIFSGLRLLAEGRKAERELQDHRLIKILARYRHDWMNDIQVLFGYAQLQKVDKLMDCVGKINANVNRESLLARLGVPSLIAFYYDFITTNPDMELELDIEREIRLDRLPLHSGRVVELICTVVSLFSANVKADEGSIGTLSLAFDVEEDALLLDFVFEGEIELAIAEQLEGLTGKFARDQVTVEQDWSGERAVVAFRLPFRMQALA